MPPFPTTVSKQQTQMRHSQAAQFIGYASRHKTAATNKYKCVIINLMTVYDHIAKWSYFSILNSRHIQHIII